MRYSVELRDISVSYHIRGRLLPDTAVDHAQAAAKLLQSRKWVKVEALKNIGLQLSQGDRLGLIGANGAGKTTLLKVLAGIMPPSEGYVAISGRISPLLSITLGLDNEASGYENVAIRGRILGISSSEVADQIEEIAEFSELGDYLSLPLKAYSAGMKLRLAFGIATAFHPEVLVMDEWLSAGDEKFQKKAKTRLENMISSSGVFVFASQNRQLQKTFCDTGLVLNRGEKVFLGPIDEAYKFVDSEL